MHVSSSFSFEGLRGYTTDMHVSSSSYRLGGVEGYTDGNTPLPF
jgi:hypothetical protein